MSELRLGDIVDDYCIKCKRLTNHAIVSIMEGEIAKVRCRSCYHDHTFLHEIAPPTKKELKKAELDSALLAQANGSDHADDAAVTSVDNSESSSNDAPSDATKSS
jgi:hypothetical protein